VLIMARYSREMEIETTWQGRTVLLYVDYTVTGRWSRAYPETRTSPAEPSEFDITEETFELTAAHDAETADDLVLTDALRAFARAEAGKEAERRRDHYAEQWAEDGAVEDEEVA
jgi:hypothetical protein